MILVLGVGIVGRAVIEHFSKNTCFDVCFFDDQVNVLENYAHIPYFDPENVQQWEQIELVVASPGFALKHSIIQEAMRRHIRVTNDIALFFEQKRNGVRNGVNIGITGTNGKSTVCALLKHVLGEKARIGGNFGISPLTFDEADFYIIELSSYQLELLEIEDLKNLEIGVIINIYPNHLNRHGSFEDYIAAKCKILSAKHSFLGHCDLFENWDFPKASVPKELPKSQLFEREEYKYAWSVVEYVLDILKLDKNAAREIAASYETLPYRQQVIVNDPIKIINDSKSSNAIAVKQALKNANEPIVWIAGGAGKSDWSDFRPYARKIKKAFICGASSADLEQMCLDCDIDYQKFEKLEQLLPVALEFCMNNKIDLLFSPGYASFDQFKNFEDRGQKFNELVAHFLNDF